MRRRHLLLGSLSCPGSAGFAAQGAAPFELLVPDDPPYAVPAVGGGPVPALVEAMFRLLGHRLRMVFVPAGIPEDPLWPSGALVAPLRPGVAPRRLTPMIELLAVPRAFATLFHGAPRGLAEAARLGPTGVRAGSACEATLRAAGFAPLLSLSDTAALAEALRSGAIAAWCGEVPALRRVAARLDLPLLIGPPLGRVPLWLAAVDPNPDLAGRLTDAYGALQAEGMVEALLGSALAP